MKNTCFVVAMRLENQPYCRWRSIIDYQLMRETEQRPDK